MRWFKKIVRAILALLPVFSIFFFVNGSSYATSHELEGIRWAYPFWESESFTSFSIGYYDHSFVVPSSPPFLHDSDPYFTRLFYFQSIWDSQLQQCVLRDGDYLRSIGYYTGSTATLELGFPYYPDIIPSSALNNVFYSADVAKCGHLNNPFSGSLPFLQDSLSNSGSPSERLFYGGVMSPYWYTSDGFWTKTKSLSTSTGQVINSSFSLSELIGFYPNRFLHLSIPVFDSVSDDSCTNSLSDRDIEFKGVFRFDGSFQWNQDFLTDSDSQFNLYVVGWQGDGGGQIDSPFPCTSNLVIVDGATQLEFSCSGHVPDYSNKASISAYLQISGSRNNGVTWVWDSDSDWSFGGLYIVTDNNDMPGCSLHDDLSGNFIGGDKTGESGGSDDWFSHLTNLFNFNLINPFAPLFTMFTDNSSCASIPTLASMIHSEETQVCPWFDSTTRSIVTPVLGIASIMLIFGFAVRWLGSSSGNMFEDQTSYKWGNTQFKQGGHK